MKTSRLRVPFLDIKAAVAAQRCDLDAAIKRVLDSGWFITGVELETFERKFANAVGSEFCVGVGNGLEALVMGLRALSVGPGDEVIVPANTFIATWLAVTAVGATILPVDADPMTGLLDMQAVESVISDRTKCIIPVHLYGHVVSAKSLRAITNRYGIAVLEDAAQAHLAQDGQGVMVGMMGDAAAFSFYPGKNLGALGDGGALVTQSPEIDRHVRLLRNYGSQEKYIHEIAGGNSRLDEIQAAILSVRLATLEAGNTRRRAIAERYQSVCTGTAARMPVSTPESLSAWHLAPVWSDQRAELREYLAHAGIETQIHYPVPPHRTPVYANTFSAGEFPVAEDIARRTLSLPIDPYMTEGQVDHVCESLEGYLTQ